MEKAFFAKITGFRGKIFINASLKKYSTFRTGGKCSVLFIPVDSSDLQFLVSKLGEKPVIVGKGANILFSDKYLDRPVIYTGKLDKISISDNLLECETGAIVNKACIISANHALSGLEFLYGMPGTIGGAVWMNARCYGKSIDEILDYVDLIDENYTIKRYNCNRNDFSYKKSPFQNKNVVILSVALRVIPADRKIIKTRMAKNLNDRRRKGHFRYPSAGSVFKNNHDFGAPSGKIIDDCGLKGIKYGRAQVAPYHGNIIINRGRACSRDIFNLIKIVEDEVLKKTGYQLEREIQLIGDWND